MTPEKPKWYMYPELHSQVSPSLAADDIRCDIDDDATAFRAYNTNIMGRFACDNEDCATGSWSSRKIAITIRLYDGGGGYNVRVYGQHCRACHSISRPFLDEASYAARVVYRVKKWFGVEVQPPYFAGGVHTGKHETRLCEGCAAGCCTADQEF